MTYPQMDPRRLDLSGSFGLRVAGRDAAEVRIGTAGRWGQRVNLALSPVPNAARWGHYLGSNGLSGVQDWTTPDGPHGRTFWEFTVTASPTASTNARPYPNNNFITPVTPGEQIRVGVYLRVTTSASIPSAHLAVEWRNADNTGTGGATATGGHITPITGHWHFLTAVFTVPSDAGYARPYGVPYITPAFAVGDKVAHGPLLIEDVTDLAAQWSALPDPKPTLAAWLDERLGSGYFDGDTESTREALHHWTGTPHASTSVQTLAWTPGD